MNDTSTAQTEHQPRPLIDMAVSIVIPSIILMKLSGEHRLGADGALVLALAFPLGWGLWELVRYRKFNWIALLGLVSVLLTGGIGAVATEYALAGHQGSGGARADRARGPVLHAHSLSADPHHALQPEGHQRRQGS